MKHFKLLTIIATMKHFKLLTIIATMLFVSGCVQSLSKLKSNPPVVVNETHGVDGALVFTETTMGAKQYQAKSSVAGDVAIANATAECWKAQAKLGESDKPDGMSGTEFAMVTLANALVKSNQPVVTPCSNMGTNSNDVLVAKENGKTQRSLSRWNVAPKLLGIAAGGYTAAKGLDALASIAANAGNKTVINGDGNKANTTSQDADNGSVISDSGNYEEQTAPFGGIALGEGSVEPVTFSTESEEQTVDQTFSEQCIAAGGDSIRDTVSEDDPTHVVDGQVCSDGVGGTLEL